GIPGQTSGSAAGGSGGGGSVSGSSGQGAYPGSAGGSGSGTGRSLSELDREFAKSLEGFGTAMSEEQIKIAERNAGERGAGTAAGTGTSPGGSGYGYPSETEGDGPGGSGGPQAGGQGGSGSAGGSVGGSGGQGTSTAPPDVGSGSDDDIVARQLREAAESESDPALREKLWDEYRQYKQSLGK
ncbi:MAG: hypothetical protein WBN65_05900, partial [Gammaproteobacteria bacterium]